jgi:hypothetical protein
MQSQRPWVCILDPFKQRLGFGQDSDYEMQHLQTTPTG